MANARMMAMMLAIGAVAGCGEANIEVQCTMNGFGQGRCSFTNTGKAAGAMCGRIQVFKVDGSEPITSNRFCSGEVGKMTTTQVEFSVPEVRTFCDPTGDQEWTDVCGFVFEKSGD